MIPRVMEERQSSLRRVVWLVLCVVAPVSSLVTCGNVGSSSQEDARPGRDASLSDHTSPPDRTLGSRDQGAQEDHATRDHASPVDHLVPPDRAAPPRPIDVLTHHNDVGRSGANLAETVLTAENVSSGTFGKLFSIPVDALIYAQPLYISQLGINGGTHNVLVVATSSNSVYAFDADTAAVLWHATLGPPTPSGVLMDGDNPVQVGVLSTPVIQVNDDRSSGLIYVTSANYRGPDGGVVPDGSTDGTPTVSLHVLDLATGGDAPGSPLLIAASVAGNAEDSGTVTFNATNESQRPGLLLVGNTVYLGFAAYKDQSLFHGWVMAYQYDGAHLTQTGVFNSTPNGNKGGVWQSGSGLVADSAGNVYAETGNGSVGPSPEGGLNYGEAILKLTPGLELADWFIPAMYTDFNPADEDLSSAGGVLLPGTSLLVGGCKSGDIYVVDTTNMGHLDPSGDQNVQSFLLTSAAGHGAGVYGGPVIWNQGGPKGATRFYVWGSAAYLKEYMFQNGSFGTSPVATATVGLPTSGGGQSNAAGFLSLSANATVPGSGIVWGTVPPGPAYVGLEAGTFYAFDAASLQVLWSSADNPTRDGMGLYAKFVPPTVVNGKVYLATDSLQVNVYGLLPD